MSFFNLTKRETAVQLLLINSAVNIDINDQDFVIIENINMTQDMSINLISLVKDLKRQV